MNSVCFYGYDNGQPVAAGRYCPVVGEERAGEETRGL